MRSWRRSTKHTLRYVGDAMLGGGQQEAAHQTDQMGRKQKRCEDGSADARRALLRLATTHRPPRARGAISASSRSTSTETRTRPASQHHRIRPQQRADGGHDFWLGRGIECCWPIHGYAPLAARLQRRRPGPANSSTTAQPAIRPAGNRLSSRARDPASDRRTLPPE